jgi:hypothetical protein
MEADLLPWKAVGTGGICGLNLSIDEGANDVVDADEYGTFFCTASIDRSRFLFFLNLAIKPFNPGPDDAAGVTWILYFSKSVELGVRVAPEEAEGGDSTVLTGDKGCWEPLLVEDLRLRGYGVTSSALTSEVGFDLSVPFNFLILWPNLNDELELETRDAEGRGIVSTLVVAETSLGLEIWSRFILFFGVVPASTSLEFEGIFLSAIVAASTFRWTSSVNSWSWRFGKLGELICFTDIHPEVEAEPGERSRWGLDMLSEGDWPLGRERGTLKGVMAGNCTGDCSTLPSSSGPKSALARFLFRLVGLETSDKVRSREVAAGVVSSLLVGITIGVVFGDCIELITESSRALALEASEFDWDSSTAAAINATPVEGVPDSVGPGGEGLLT